MPRLLHARRRRASPARRWAWNDLRWTVRWRDVATEIARGETEVKPWVFYGFIINIIIIIIIIVLLLLLLLYIYIYLIPEKCGNIYGNVVWWRACFLCEMTCWVQLCVFFVGKIGGWVRKVGRLTDQASQITFWSLLGTNLASWSIQKDNSRIIFTNCEAPVS